MSFKCNRQVQVESISQNPTARELTCSVHCSTFYLIYQAFAVMSIDCQDNIMHYVPDSFSSSLQEKEKKKTLLHSGIITRVAMSPNHQGVSRIELPLLKSYIDSIYSNTGKNN